MRRHVAHHRALDRADIGDDGAGSKMRADLLGHRATGADRDADDDEIGAFDRRGVRLDDLVGKAELGDAPACLRRARGRHDRAHRALRLGGARDRGADQPDTDQRESIEQGRRRAHAAVPRKSFKACTTSRLASSVPTVSRKALGKPYPATRRRINPCLVRNASASAAARPFVSGKWMSTKFATLGVTLRPSFSISCVSQASQRLLCAIEVSWCAVSSMAAMPAFIAGVLTLNGPRTRLSASTMAAGP